MALRKKKLPIQIGGLDTKTDDTQALTGTFKIMDNVVYDKIGRIDKRKGLKTDNKKFNSLQNTQLTHAPKQVTRYTDTSSTLIEDKISKYLNSNELLLLTRSHNGKADLHSYNRGFLSTAEQLTADIDVKNMAGNSLFNPELAEVDAVHYNEQFQNSAYESNFDLTATSSFDSFSNSHSFKILQGEKEIYAFTRQNSGSSNQSLFSKMMFFKTSATQVVLVHISTFNNFGGTRTVNCQFFRLEQQSATGAFTVDGPNSQLVTNYGFSLNDDRISFDIEKLDDTHFAFVSNNSAGVGIDLQVFVVDYATGITSTAASASTIIVSNYFHSVSIRKLDASVGAAGFHYLLVAFNQITGAYGTVIKTAILKIPTAYGSAATVHAATASIHDFVTRGIVNIGIGDHTLGEVSDYNVSIYVTTCNTTTLSDSDYRLNQIERISYNTATNAKRTHRTIFTKMTLASKPASKNYNDYFLMSYCDINQPSMYLGCSDGRNNQLVNDTVVSRFFWGNTAMFYPSYITNKPFGTTIYQCWVTNLNIKELSTDSLTFKAELTGGKYNYQPKFICAVPYREKFINLNNQLDSTLYSVKDSSFNSYDSLILTHYKDSNSTKLVTFNLNSKNRFSSVEINQTKYFTGGHLSCFDGNKLDNPNFFQFPILKSAFGSNSTLDPLLNKLTNSVIAASDELQYATGSSTFLKVGDLVKVLTSGTLPAGLTQDATAVLPSPYTALTKEYTVKTVTISGANTKIILEDAGVQVDITSTGADAIYVLKAPYQNFTAKTYVGFIAVYEYRDNNGKLYRSAPSQTLYKYIDNDLIYKTSIYVLNYDFKNKRVFEAGVDVLNPVNVKIYRTTGNGAVFYECASVKCDMTSEYIVVDIQNPSESKLVGNAVLYTTGGVLDNIAPPACSSITIKNDRIYAVNAEFKNEIWYSKKIIQGEAIEFSDLLTISVDDSDGKILSIQTMDDKIIIFKNNKIYYITGDGANELGLGSSFSNVEKLSNDVGLDEFSPRAVLLTDLGIFFKSEKGVYLLGRALNLVYIGAGLDDYFNDITKVASPFFTTMEIYNIIDVKDKNEVKLITNYGAFSYNTLQSFWTRSAVVGIYCYNSPKFYDGYSDNDGFYLLSYQFEMKRSSDNKLYDMNVVLKERSDEVYGDEFNPLITGFTNPNNPPGDDVNVDYQVSLKTNWINPNKLQNFNRLYNLFFLGIGKMDSSSIYVYYNYSNDLNIEDVYTGAGAADSSHPFQFKTHIRNMKCQSFVIHFIVNSLYTSGKWSLTNIEAEFGVKVKTPLTLGNKT